MSGVVVKVRGPKGQDVQLLRGVAGITRTMAKRIADVRLAFSRQDWNLLRAALLVFAEDMRPLSDEIEKLARVLYAKADVVMPAPREGESAVAYLARLQQGGVEYVRDEVK